MAYYTHSGYPAQSAAGASVDARTEFDAIAAGFSLIAPYSGYGGRIVRINAGGTAQESVTLATATIESYADAQAGTHHILTTVAGTNTITATATPTLAAYVTNQTFQFAAAGANTGAATIAIDGLAAKNLVRPDGSALLAGDIVGAGFIANITIRATDAVLNNPTIATKASTVTTNANLTGNVTSVGNATTIASLPSISGASLTNLTAANISAGTAAINISGQAATVASVTGATGNIAGSSGSCTGNAATAINATGSALVTGNFGYATGAGGSVTQTTNESTPVTLNTMCGRITTVSMTRAANTQAVFIFNNSNIAADDLVMIQSESSYGPLVMLISAQGTTAGSRTIICASSVGFGPGTVSFKFAIIKAVVA